MNRGAFSGLFRRIQNLSLAGKGRKIPLAFTLLELLIASSILVVLVAVVYSAFHTGIFSHRNIEETINIYQAARQALERINLDLRNSFIYSQDEAKFIGNKNDISFLTLVDTFIEEKIISEYALVSYAQEGNKLMRLCKRNKDSLNNKSAIQPDQMFSNIEDIVFSYGYIPQTGQPLEWKDSWGGQGGPREEQQTLPIAVKIKLTLKNKTKQEFERTIYLPR